MKPLRAPLLRSLLRRFDASTGVSTDTRSLQKGQLFIALRGPSFDGNQYAQQALNAGASAVVVDDPAVAESLGKALATLVPDGLQALQELAHAHRMRWGGRLIALTGSNGKTTTKELLAAALGKQYRVLATPGNWNNHIGLPLTLLLLTEAHELALLEMGENGPDELTLLCELAQPEVALITNVGEDHMEGYGSHRANVAAKLELFQWVDRHGGHLFINKGDFALRSYPAPPERSTDYNARESRLWAHAVAEDLATQTLMLNGPGLMRPTRLTVNLPGAHNRENVLAAAVVALHYCVEPQEVCDALASYLPKNNRSQLLTLNNGLQVYLDAYNANPSSMEPTIAHVCQQKGRKVALILGDMLEQGSFAVQAHRRVGQWVANGQPAVFLAVGQLMEEAAVVARQAEVPVWHYPNREALASELAQRIAGCDLILLKGSRGQALEQLLPLLEAIPAG